jgi:hypothetical protein
MISILMYQKLNLIMPEILDELLVIVAILKSKSQITQHYKLVYLRNIHK